MVAAFETEERVSTAWARQRRSEQTVAAEPDA
jgi:hypothetical protein